MTSRIGRGKTGSQQAPTECLLCDHRADWKSSSLTHTVYWHPGIDTSWLMSLFMCPPNLSKDELGTLSRDIVPLSISLNLLHKASWKPLLEAWTKVKVRCEESRGLWSPQRS